MGTRIALALVVHPHSLAQLVQLRIAENAEGRGERGELHRSELQLAAAGKERGELLPPMESRPGGQDSEVRAVPPKESASRSRPYGFSPRSPRSSALSAIRS